jgi:hypothetical protein
MTEDLTAFQRQALADVSGALAVAGQQPVSLQTLGNREKYLVIAFSGYRVILYLDGAEILGNGLDLRFEKEDFDNLALLRKQLLTELRPLIVQAQR